MKIYVGHSTSFDYIKELYEPLKGSSLCSNHQFIFPHDENKDVVMSKNIIADSDLFLAEVSYPSIGLGIELGWAHDKKCKILCIAKQGAKLSPSLKIICSDILMYSDKSTMINNIVEWIGNAKF